MPDGWTLIRPAAASSDGWTMVQPASARAKTAEGFDTDTLYDPKRRPVSAEDFAPTAPPKGMPEQVWNAIKGYGKATLGQIPSTLEALSDLQRGTLGGDMEAAQRTKDRAAALYESQLSQFDKAGREFAEGQPRAAIAHGITGLIPLVGPAMAQAGEKIGAGDVEGVGEAAAILTPSLAKAVAPLAPKLATIGEQIASKGKPVISLAKKGAKAAAPYAVTAAADAALSAVGVPPVVTASRVARIVGDAMEARKAAAAASEAPSVIAPNAGGRVVPASAPTVEQAVSGALSDLQKPELPRRITTPPEPSLPPSYTPRTTVPKDVPKRMAKAAAPEPAAAPTPPKRAYFLRPPEEVAAIQARKAAAAAPETIAPVDITDPAQMPEAWRSRMGPPELPKPRKPATKVTRAEIDELAKGLTDSGLTAREAIRRISKDSSMSAETRVRLMTALGKLAKGQVERAAVSEAPAVAADEFKVTSGWEPSPKQPWKVRADDGRLLKSFDSAEQMQAFLKNEKSVQKAYTALRQP